jgi:hypothetical protein
MQTSMKKIRMGRVLRHKLAKKYSVLNRRIKIIASIIPLENILYNYSVVNMTC